MKTRLVLLLMSLCLVFCSCEDAVEDKTMKNVTVEVVANEKTEKFSFSTDEAYLGEALDDIDLIEGEDGQYGMFIESVNGIKADTKKQQWWCITKDGENVMTGVDLTPISDGDKFELTLMTGY